MHILESKLLMIVDHWTGNYKDLDASTKDYQWDKPGKKTVLNAIGAACTSSGNSIPGFFGRHVPNLSTQCGKFIAKSWIIFATILAPTVFHYRFKKRIYYSHFMKLICLVNLCMQFGLDVDKIKHRLVSWVVEYER